MQLTLRTSLERCDVYNNYTPPGLRIRGSLTTTTGGPVVRITSGYVTASTK